MSMLMIRCPKTGQAISTGREVESAAFRSTAVFFSRTYCPLCRLSASKNPSWPIVSPLRILSSSVRLAQTG
jgi:hypothetical protein